MSNLISRNLWQISATSCVSRHEGSCADYARGGKPNLGNIANPGHPSIYGCPEFTPSGVLRLAIIRPSTSFNAR